MSLEARAVVSGQLENLKNTKSLMYALENVGLASCPINWPDVSSREMAWQMRWDFKAANAWSC